MVLYGLRVISVYIAGSCVNNTSARRFNEIQNRKSYFVYYPAHGNNFVINFHRMRIVYCIQYQVTNQHCDPMNGMEIFRTKFKKCRDRLV